MADASETELQHTPLPLDLPPSLLGPPARAGDLGTLGKYRVVGLLGQGGMGYVFRGHDDALGRSVALKVMKPEAAAVPSAKARFLREGRAAAGLRSDHVVVIYTIDGDGPGETPYLAMEDLAGGTLEQLLAAAGGTLDPAAAARVARHALRGLITAHAKGLTHRDIKPSNLWVESRSDRVKLLDFGIVRDAADPGAATAPGQVLGSVAYMAVEQALGGAVDGRADLYSLGVVLYRALVGVNPFEKGSHNESLIAVYNDTPPPAHVAAPGVPADLSAFVARMMSKDRDARPKDAVAALAELEAIERRLTAASAAPTVASEAAAVKGWPSRQLLAAALAAVAVGIPVALLGVFAGGPRKTADGTAPTAAATRPVVLKGGDERDFEVAPGVSVRFCWIPAGAATLGSPTAEAGRQPDEAEAEFATPGFWLGKYEVTQAEWAAATGGANLSYFDGTKDNSAKEIDTRRFPVESVSWEDAADFCNRASRHAGRVPRYAKGSGVWVVAEGANGFGLPHEDEWEYACRGGNGNQRPFHFGAVLNGHQANCEGNYPYGTEVTGPFLRRPRAVDDTNGGDYGAHGWGLCHAHGNVWELCENVYEVAAADRVVRGGSWGDHAVNCRTAYRRKNVPGDRNKYVGLRLRLPPG